MPHQKLTPRDVTALFVLTLVMATTMLLAITAGYLAVACLPLILGAAARFSNNPPPE